jgi:molybdopterin molybdotransferase
MALLSVNEALSRILEGVEPVATETVPLVDAAGRILAKDLTASWDQPPFDASAMDGYAVQNSDVKELPVTLDVVGEAAAGRPWSGTVRPGSAVRIFTGAPVPDGADAIVIQENTERHGNKLSVNAGRPDPAHIRGKGGDFKAGATLLKAGLKLNARDLLLAAAAGHATLAVRRKPIVAILATGDELVEPGQTPGPGQIVSSNPYGLVPMIRGWGGEALLLGIARDKRDALAEKIEAASRADVLVTIGGASVGDHDLVVPALEAAGTEISFWKIAMRPGKPMMFGRRGSQLVLGLPGNPVSSMICGRVFLVPLIVRMLGESTEGAHHLRARVAAPLEANGPRAHFMRAKLGHDANGDSVVTPLANQDSSLMSALAAADCLIVREVGAAPLPAGAPVDVLPIDF